MKSSLNSIEFFTIKKLKNELETMGYKESDFKKYKLKKDLYNFYVEANNQNLK